MTCPRCDLTFREASNLHELPPHAANCSPADRLLNGTSSDPEADYAELQRQVRNAAALVDDCEEAISRARGEEAELRTALERVNRRAMRRAATVLLPRMAAQR